MVPYYPVTLKIDLASLCLKQITELCDIKKIIFASGKLTMMS